MKILQLTSEIFKEVKLLDNQGDAEKPRGAIRV